MEKGSRIDLSGKKRNSEALAALTSFWGSQGTRSFRTEENLLVQKSLKQILSCIGEGNKEFPYLFSPSDLEGLFSFFLKIFDKTQKKHFFLPEFFDESFDVLGRMLEERGFYWEDFPLSEDGTIHLEKFKKKLHEEVAFVFCPWAHPFTGVVQPVEEMGKICKEKKVFFHLEGSLALGKLFFSFPELEVDFFSLSGRFLNISPGVFLVGKSKEFLKREEIGQDPFFLIELGAVCENILEKKSVLDGRENFLRNFFEKQILEKNFGATVLFQKSFRLPQISCISFPKIFQEALLFALERRNFSAYFSGKLIPDYLRSLFACGIKSLEAQGALKFSFSEELNEEVVLRAVEILEEEVLRLRKLSQELVI